MTNSPGLKIERGEALLVVKIEKGRYRKMAIKTPTPRLGHKWCDRPLRSMGCASAYRLVLRATE